LNVLNPMREPSAPGSVLAARYRVIERLGQGGMGIVYRVVDQASGEVAALKTLPLRRGIDDRRLLLFKTEFWAMTRLRHPNLPKVHDFGNLEDGTPYFTMELVEGADLKDSLPLSLHRFYDVFTQLAQALSFIHARRLVHRDVKASNVRLTEQDGRTRVVLMDFGLVSVLGESAAGQGLSGTAAYLAPEAGHGGVVDARADLFSLGVLAAEALIGRIPRRFAAGSAPASLSASGTHLDLSGLTGFPPGLVSLLRKLVADAPSRRPASADLVVDTLVGLSGGDDPRTGTAQKRSYLATSSLVGREPELGRLRAAMDATFEGRGGVLLVAGPAGAGKTRLLREFRVEAMLRGALWAGGAGRNGVASPLQPVVEALTPFLSTLARDAASSLRRHAPGLLPVMPGLAPHVPGVEAAPPLQDPAAEAARLLDEVGAVVSALADLQPLVLALDDLQWADGTTLRFVEKLLDGAGRGARLLVLCTVRSDEVGGSPPLARLLGRHRRATLRLGPFDAGMIRELLAEQFGVEEVGADVVDALWRRTGGNAFFLHELLRYMVDEDLVRFAGGRWHLPESLVGVPLPGQLSDILRRRLDARSAEEVELLEIFAVAGRPLDLWLLTRLAGPERDQPIFARVDALRVHDLVAVDGEVVSVRHDRILEFTYERMSPERRTEIHGRVARVMDKARTNDPEQYAFPSGEVGRQYRAGGLLAEAAENLIAGAERAFRVQALEEAIALAGEAEETLVDLGERQVGGRMDRVQELLLRSVYAQSPTRALPIADRAIARYRALGWLDRVPRWRLRFGKLGLVVGLAGTLVAARRSGMSTSDFVAMLRRFLTAATWRAQGLSWASRYREALEAADEVALFAPPDSAGTVASLIAANGALLFTGRLREQSEGLERAYALLRGKPGAQFAPFDRRVAVRGAVGGGYAMGAIWRSDPEALRWLDLEDGVDDDIAPTILEGVEALARVCFHAARGEARAMEAEYRRYLTGKVIIRPEEREEIEHWVAWACVDRGEHERARELADTFVHRGPISEAWASLIRARLPGTPLGRIAAAEEGIAAASREGSRSSLTIALAKLVLADAERDAGAPARCRALADEVLEVARDEAVGARLLEMKALRRRAEAWLAEGNCSAAVRDASDALDVATATRNPLERAFALRTLGAAEAASLRHADAERWCSAASAEFEELDNDYQLRALRDLVADPRVGLSSHTATMTLAGDAVAGGGRISPEAASLLVGSLDLDATARGVLDVIGERLPDRDVVLFLAAGEHRPARVLVLDAGGEITDAPEAMPLSVISLAADDARMRAEFAPVRDGGWLLPLRAANAAGGAPAAAVYLPPEPEPVPEALVRDLRVILTLAAAGVRNALHHEQLMQREYRLTMTNQLGQVLGAVRDSADLITVILDRMLDLGRADKAFIMLRDGPGGELTFRAARDIARHNLPGSDFAVSRGLIEEALRSREILRVDDELDLAERTSIQGLELKSVTVVPLRSIVGALGRGDEAAQIAQQTLLTVDASHLGEFLRDTASEAAEAIGVVYLESRARFAGAQDRALLRLLADQAGFAIDISRLQQALVKEAAAQERLKQRQQQLMRYMSADVAEAVMARPDLLQLGSARRAVTILFADVRGFTAWASTRSPEVVVAALNRIFSVQTEVLFAHGGTLDKFLGDGLMAIFGAPIHDDHHAERAVSAAAEMQLRVRALLEEMAAEQEEDRIAGIGIGVHSGIAAVGNIGSELRMEYTAIGDTVNLASRLCDHAAPGQVLVSRVSAEQSGLPGDRFHPVDDRTVKGRSEPVEVVEVVLPPA